MKVISNGQFKNNNVSTKFEYEVQQDQQRYQNKSAQTKPANYKNLIKNLFLFLFVGTITLSGWGTSYFLYKTAPEAKTIVLKEGPLSGAVMHAADMQNQIEAEEVEADSAEKTEVIKKEVAEATPTEGGASAYDDMSEYYYSLVPEDIRSVLEAQGYTYEVTSGLIGGYSVDYHNHIIHINSTDRSNLLKGIGEIIYFTNLSTNENFSQAFVDEREKAYNVFKGGKSEYESEDKYAAISFYLYTLKPNKLMLVAPRTYEIISQVNLNTISESDDNN